MSIFDRRRPYRALRRLLDRIYRKKENLVSDLEANVMHVSTFGGAAIPSGGDENSVPIGSPQAAIVDSDSDTIVHTESNADEDKIRFETAGTERMVLDAGNCDISGAFSGRFKADDTTNSASITMSSRSGGASKPGISAGGTNIPLRLGTDSRIGVVKISEQHDQVTLGGDLSDSTDFGCRLVIGTGSGDTRPALGIKESATTPGATSGIGKIYVKSTDSTKLYFKDEVGTETDLTAGGGGGDPDQNLWETVSSDSGSTTANTTTDTLTIAGGTGVSTAVAGDTLTITATGGGGGTVQGTDGTRDIQATDDGLPDGNARGEDSTDLQTKRTNASEVAGGANSTICGGYDNTATGDASFVGGGNGNTASGQNATVSGGGNTASAINTTSFGSLNVSSAASATVSGGGNNTASGTASTVCGGNRAVASRYGEYAFASGRFSADGDAQTSIFVLRETTTNATPKELALDGGTSYITVPTDSASIFKCYIIGARTDSPSAAEMCGYEITGIISNISGTTALTNTTVTATNEGLSALSRDATVTADNTNDRMAVTVTGEAGETIQWVARVDLTSTEW